MNLKKHCSGKLMPVDNFSTKMFSLKIWISWIWIRISIDLKCWNDLQHWINHYFLLFRGYRDRHDDDRGGSRGFSSYEPARDRDRGDNCLFSSSFSEMRTRSVWWAILPSRFGDAVWYGVLDPGRTLDPLFCSKICVPYIIGWYRTVHIAQRKWPLLMLIF